MNSNIRHNSPPKSTPLTHVHTKHKAKWIPKIEYLSISKWFFCAHQKYSPPQSCAFNIFLRRVFTNLFLYWVLPSNAFWVDGCHQILPYPMWLQKVPKRIQCHPSAVGLECGVDAHLGFLCLMSPPCGYNWVEIRALSWHPIPSRNLHTT